MKKAITSIFSVIILLISAGFTTAAACMISPSINHPLMPDSDCDGIIDSYDNCPFITNPLQQDIDDNGLGDACDIFLESLGTSPSDFVYNTRAFTVTASLHNNRDFNVRNIRVRVMIPDLGIESTEEIYNIDVCESKSIEFTLRAPNCAAEDSYDVIVDATFTNEFGIQEKIGGYTTIRVIPDNYCKEVLAGNGILGNTYVDVMEIQDVYKGGEAVFPVKISNREFQDKDYVISVTGLENWGNYRLTPNSLIIVPAGTDRIANIYISAKEDVPPGERLFVVTIKNGEEYQRFLLIANVKEQPIEDRSVFFIFGFKIFLIMLFVVIIIFLVALGIAKYLTALRHANSE